MKILNLYAGIGGNRKLWNEFLLPPTANGDLDYLEVTAVENVPYIAEAYRKLFPNDTVIEADAHQYLLDHFKEFDFIWSSPPCPTHSQLNTAISGWGIHRYPDMSLYQEIIFLKHFYKGNWLVENVVSYYDPLITPRTTFGRHYFWANFYVPRPTYEKPYDGILTHALHEELASAYGIALPDNVKNKRKLLRNAVDPKIGLHILNAALKETKQEVLL